MPLRCRIRLRDSGALIQNPLHVGDHENGPKTNHGGAVNNGRMRKNNRQENVFFTSGHNKGTLQLAQSFRSSAKSIRPPF